MYYRLSPYVPPEVENIPLTGSNIKVTYLFNWRRLPESSAGLCCGWVTLGGSGVVLIVIPTVLFCLLISLFFLCLLPSSADPPPSVAS